MIASVYEIYYLINLNIDKDIGNKCLKKNYINFLRILIPFTPHLASECLEQLDEKKLDTWPVIDTNLIQDQKIKIAIQINGKTREIIEISKDMLEKDVIFESKKNAKIKKNLMNKNIIRVIFVKNKIINYLVK